MLSPLVLVPELHLSNFSPDQSNHQAFIIAANAVVRYDI